jgi:hypothetical protein
MTDKLFNFYFWVGKSFMRVTITLIEDFMAKTTKPTKAEEEKKKKAYYAKTEKKAKQVKK